MSEIDEKDNEICNGCLCLRIAKAGKLDLTAICHGNPFIRIADTNNNTNIVLTCPCEHCLIKAMCQEVCTRYRSYDDVATGKVTIEWYQQNY